MGKMVQMRKTYPFVVWATVLLVAMPSVLAGQGAERPDLAEVFVRHNVVGTFVLHDISNDQLVLVNSDRAAERRFPASTFKIANSLLALETGVIADENEVVPYGGKPQMFKSWERDMSIRDGIKISNVPVFQELASRIGIDRYRKWLAVLQYGNAEIGENVKTFWLKGPLKVSPIEQVRFLSKLAQKKLPLSQRSQAIVTEIIRLERKGTSVLYGKTGWSGASSPETGWFVGWVEGEKGIFTFAMNMDIVSRQDAKKRKLLTKSLLSRLGVY